MTSHDVVRSPKSAHPAGFTLVELLIVMGIIAALAALLVPAIISVQNKVRTAEVKTEIGKLETAIAGFRAEFNQDPPSRIVLYEKATGTQSWASDGVAGSATDLERIRSIALMRSLFGNSLDFTVDNDINGDSTFEVSPGVGQKYVLSGPECLVFFLGGIPESGGSPGNYVLKGFSKNPANPFLLGGTRIGPFFEFDHTRLKDVDGDGALAYLDPIPSQAKPYIYLSSYDGKGYQSDDYTFYSPSTLLSEYQANCAVPPCGSWKNKSFQIISPGFDFEYGSGGIFDPEANGGMLSDQFDKDNITNFHPGQLGS